MTKALERMRKLIDGVVTEIRLRGKAEIKQSKFLLIDLINEAAATAKIAKKSKDINWEQDVDPTIKLTADHDMVFTALLNLMNNAIKFTKKPGRNVSIRGKGSEGRILIEIEDECGGLPDKNTEKLFAPFAQKGDDKSGLGLGLSISRRAIELNKGKLTTRSTPGKGCIFTINLPK